MTKSRTTKKNENAPALFVLGESGLKRQSGVINEEFHQKLKGAMGRKAFNEMAKNDAIIGASLWIIEAICRQVTWSVEEADSESALKGEAATIVDQAYRDMDRAWRDIVAEVLTMIIFGWALFEPTYKIRRGPQFKESRLRSKHDDGLYGWRDWGLRAQESLYNWEFNEEGTAIAMWQLPPADSKMRCIPFDRSILFRVRGSKGNPEGMSLLRPIYPRYFDGKRLRSIEGIGIERNIAGMPVMEVPANIANAVSGTAEHKIKLEYLKFVKRIRNDAYYGAVIPAEDLPDGKKSGYRFRLLSSSGRSFADVNTSIQRNAKELAMAMMTEHMFLGIDKVGALATHGDKTNMLGYGIEALLGIVQDQGNQIAIPRLMALNDYPVDAWPTWNHGEVSRRAITEIFTAVTGAISGGALEADEDIDKYLREQLDLKPRSGPRMDEIAGTDGGDVLDEEAAQPGDQLELPLGDEDMVEIAVPPEPERPYISVDDIMEQTGRSRNSVMGALRSGTLPGNKVGSSWCVPRKDFDVYMQGKGGVQR